jgi:hypothetical protein
VRKLIEKRKFIIRHKRGYFINVMYEKARDFDTAVRFGSWEEANYFLREGHYAAPDPDNYEIYTMLITYELEGQAHERNEASA